MGEKYSLNICSRNLSAFNSFRRL